MPLIFLNIFQILISRLFHSKLKPNKSSPHLNSKILFGLAKFVNLPVLNDWNIQMELIVHVVIKNLYVNILLVLLYCQNWPLDI